MDGFAELRVQRVLVVDDDRIQILIVSRMLANTGIEFDCATNLGDARAHVARRSYDFLILDLSLRNENGLDLLHSVVRMGQRPRVLFISCMDRRVLAASSRVALALGLPIAGALPKPISEGDLITALGCPAPGHPRREIRPIPQPSGQDLIRSIGSDAIFSLFQPKIELATGALIGIEALARWSSPEHGSVPPEIFVPLAEATGCIGQLTDQVMREALSTCARLRDAGLLTEVAVNLSPICLQDSGLPDRIESLLAMHDLSPGNLVLEVTESHAVNDPKVIELLTRLRMRGVGLSIDDFGTGHSTLLSLLRMPFSELKIDKSFVLALGVDLEAEKIVRTTIAMARELGLRSVAEGVETQAVSDVLDEMGCDVGQGWLYGKPTVVSELLAFAGAGGHSRPC